LPFAQVQGRLPFPGDLPARDPARHFRHHGVDGKAAGHLTRRVPAHAVRDHEEAARRVDAEGVLVVATDAPDVRGGVEGQGHGGVPGADPGSFSDNVRSRAARPLSFAGFFGARLFGGGASGVFKAARKSLAMSAPRW
jgi:hypothetical protein